MPFDNKGWVLQLSQRLMANGVDVILDQWDVTLGGDLPLFMERGLADADRILAVCTPKYVAKANAMLGGVGYEKMILTSQLMKDLSSDRIIPIVRIKDGTCAVPTFLESKRYIDFSQDENYESNYGELIADIHQHRIKPRPALGSNPFAAQPPPPIEPKIAFSSERYASPASFGTVTFNYSNNNGRYVVGSGDTAFETYWSGASNTAIYALNDPSSIRTVALVEDIETIDQIKDASLFDTSSRSRMPFLGQIVIWQNTAGYYLATQIKSLKMRGRGSPHDEVVFEYAIAPNKSKSFGA